LRRQPPILFDAIGAGSTEPGLGCGNHRRLSLANTHIQPHLAIGDVAAGQAAVPHRHEEPVSYPVGCDRQKHGPLRGRAYRQIRDYSRATPSFRHGSGDTLTAFLILLVAQQGQLLTDRGFEFAVERAVFASVLHRLFVSGSDRSCEKWMVDYRIAGIEELQLHHFYRAMAWLGEEIAAAGANALAPRCIKDLIEERLFERRRDLFSDLSLVFMDTTSLSFYGAGGESLGAYGHSKDHRADLKQMILAVVIDRLPLVALAFRLGLVAAQDVACRTEFDLQTLFPFPDDRDRSGGCAGSPWRGGTDPRPAADRGSATPPAVA
jgi:hypothetical protein